MTNSITNMIQIGFDYMEGQLSLDEAVNKMRASGAESTEETLRHLLLSTPRFNVCRLHEQKSYEGANET